MPQHKKQRVHHAIVDAARRRLAEHGVRGASLSSIAEEAGTSVGNVYKYFADKDALLAAAVPCSLVRELRAMLRRQVEALGTERDVTALPANHPHVEAAARTRRFSIRHRLELLFLLRHASGTAYESFPEDVAADLTRLATRYAQRAYPDFAPTASNRRALRRIYRAFIGSIADVVAEEKSPRALDEATRKLAAYHLAGLRAVFESSAGSRRREDPA